MKLFVATFCAKKKLNREPKNVTYLHLKIPPAALKCKQSAVQSLHLVVQWFYSKKLPWLLLQKLMGSKILKKTTSMFQQGRGMNWTVKKTTFYHLYNHTILSTYQELIKNKQTYHHYTCTELHTCFETFVMIITFSLSFWPWAKLSRSFYQLLYTYIIVQY